MDALPESLSKQRMLLERILEAVERDPAWRWLEIGCSVAAGRGDELSDLDLGAGFAEECWPKVEEHVQALVTGLGQVADALRMPLPGMERRPHHFISAQFADGAQIELVVVPARASKTRAPENLVLYDPGNLRTQISEPPMRRADAGAIFQWTFLGWWALADMAKYLRRGSLWEAMERLHEMRTQVWRLWAAGQDVPYPIYGLTSVLDFPASGLPQGIEATVATLDAADLARAAIACGDLLSQVSTAAAIRTGARLPQAMAQMARARMEQAAGPD